MSVYVCKCVYVCMRTPYMYDITTDICYSIIVYDYYALGLLIILINIYIYI